jgi:PTS system fructose-specific IIC component
MDGPTMRLGCVMQAAGPSRGSLGLADLFPPEAVVIGPQGGTLTGVVAELVRRLVALGRLNAADEQTAVDSILARERLGAGTLPEGIAFPHCRASFAERFVGALGLAAQGALFEADGGGAVHSVFLFLAPLERREELYEVLGRIAAIGRDKGLLAQLRGCRTAEDVNHFLKVLDGP